MIKKDEIDEIERTRIAREIERIREVWENGRDERNLRSTLEFKNRATWAMFKIVDGGK
jgi:hypothetical protein